MKNEKISVEVYCCDFYSKPQQYVTQQIATCATVRIVAQVKKKNPWLCNLATGILESTLVAQVVVAKILPRENRGCGIK